MPASPRRQNFDRRRLADRASDHLQKTIRASLFKSWISEAADGATAIDLCNDAVFDLVFLDCNMPGFSGLETLQRIKSIDPDIPVVMIFRRA